jgi:hypothetical protein
LGHSFVHTIWSLAEDIYYHGQVQSLLLQQSVTKFLYFISVFQEQVFGSCILFADYVSNFFVYLPVCIVTIRLLEAVAHHRAVANESNLASHTIRLYEALRYLRDLVDVIGGSSGHAVVEDFFGNSAS